MKIFGKAVATVVVIAAGAWAYYANANPSRAAMDMNMRVSPGSAPIPVILAPVERGPIAGVVTYTGNIVPFTEEEIYPRVTGRIVEMSVYPGDRVEKGQIVARLDDVELISKVREAEAMLVTAQANRTQMEADLAAARFGIAQMEKELAMTEAEAGFQRTVAARDERLFSKGAISQQDTESSRAMATSANAKVEAARAKVDQARAMEASARKKVEAADAMIAQGQAQLHTAQVVRGYVDIQAPGNGYVVKRLVAPGVLVQPGMAILKTTQVDQVRFQANVGERDLSSIKVGAPVTVTTTGGHAPIVAQVTSVFPYVDPGTRTAIAEAVVANPGRRLVPGQYVQMQFTTGERKDALAVPAGAVVRLGGKATVWVAGADERVEPREVVTGLESPDRVEIIKGLVGGERVVLQGYDGLYSGAQVTPVSGGMAPSAASEQIGQAESLSALKRVEGHAGHGTETMVAQATAPVAGDLQVSMNTAPATPKVGTNRIRVEVKDASGAPVSDAKVELNTGMTGMAGPKATARPVKDPGVYEAPVNLAMGGTWFVEVKVTRPQGGSKSTKFTIEVK